MTMRWWLAPLVAAALALTSPSGARAQAAQPGVLWETTSQTVMEGVPMQMPAQTHQHCAPAVWTAPPPSPDQSCTTSEFTRTETKLTWTVRCTGEMPMTGRGELEFDRSMTSYAGTIKLTSGEMRMTTKLSGKKLGGCDNPT
jgi:hypothetical protein